ncbi:MAG TPA: AcrB/AcrD/AcrF family protein [Parvularcula sp.]|nr:AcrB/AcrD/AcrF family protein [Parvularcula sp.]HBS35608.1 AcrB/AcrD/AcrF family protein [Parvularcula sp.]
MNGLIAWWARNPIAANMLLVAIVIAGLFSFRQIEREVFPSADFNGATVSVTWPGAAPQEIEEQIILRIEEAISGVDGVKHVDSRAQENLAVINIEGVDTGDATRLLNDIKSRVDGISTLPADAFPPVISQWRNENGAMFIALYGDMPERELTRLAREIKDELSQLPNSSPLVGLWGARKEEVSIEVSEEALRRYGLTFDDVARAVRGSSLNLSAGQVRTDTGNIAVAARSLADSADEFGEIVVRQIADGGVIRVRDVATVQDAFEDIKQKRQMNGAPTITIAVNAPETMNIVTLSDTVLKYIEKKNKELDGRAEMFVWFNTADIYYSRMNLVGGNAVQGFILVLIVLILFLRPAVAFWATAGMPVALIGAFIFMPAVGVSINILSLFGFLLVIGIVVDDAIVVGESIHSEAEEGRGGLDGAILGTQLVAKPVFFSVMTTIIAFLPWLFIAGGAADFTKHIAYTVIFALTFSLIEAFFILPAHLSHLKKEDKSGHLHRLQSFFADGLLGFANSAVRPLIKLALRFRYFTVAFFLVAFSLSVALIAQGWVPFKFEPEVQGTFVSLTVRMPEGSPYSRSLEIFGEVESAGEALKKELGQIEGEDFVKAIYISAQEGTVTSYLTIIDGDKRKQSTKDIAELFRSRLGDIPDAEEINVGYTINDGGPDFAFGIESNSLEELRLATVDLQNYMRSLPGLYDVRNSLQSETPELQISLKPGAQRFGLTLSEVTRQVRQAFYGEEAQRLPREGEDVRVMVRYPALARESLTSIESMRVRTADGREVPLTAVADATFAPSYKRIDRRDRKRSAQVTAEMPEGADRAAIMKSIQEEFVPKWRERHPGVNLAQRGDAEGQAEFLGDIGWMYIAVLIAVYMLISIAFGSVFQPLLIMSAIPFGFMGAMFGHFMLGLEFGIFSFFGVGAAAGVVINDNLVLIDYVNRLRSQGMGAVAALTKASVERFRPILLTSVTTFFGLMPIMFERSTDAQFLMPTVVALAWGVFFALFVTLFFVPSMYCVGADITRFYKWAWTGERQAPVGFGKSLDADFGEAEDRMRRPKKGPPPVLRPAE